MNFLVVWPAHEMKVNTMSKCWVIVIMPSLYLQQPRKSITHALQHYPRSGLVWRMGCSLRTHPVQTRPLWDSEYDNSLTRLTTFCGLKLFVREVIL